ncbi:VanZ family protein [Streptomyces albidoflavus]|uniref:VanZ family protein n=1 Tax=Streptomyces albidoflavus TaxID=1886 RepID=UPI0033A9BD5B
MLTAVFRDQEGFIAIGTLLVIATAAVAYRMARRRTSRPGTYALWITSAASVAILTTWTTGNVSESAVCLVNKDVLEPFRGAQGLLNMGMFVPFGLIGTVATRRPALVAGLGLLLSAGVETVQGSASVVGRLCDTSDLVANASGVAMGVVLGLALNRFDKETGKQLTARTARTLTLAACVTAIAITATWVFRITPHVVEYTVSETHASSEQEASVKSAVRKEFGGHYSVTSVQFTRGEGDSGTVTAALAADGRDGAGSAELAWPDTDQLSVSLVPTSVEEGFTFKVPDAPQPARTEDQAREVAEAYAERYAPWATEGTQLTVDPLDESEDAGWQASWRRWQGDVLLPMRLDIRMERNGSLTSVFRRNIADPDLPPMRTTIGRAWKIFEDHFNGSVQGGERAEPVLLAQERNGNWRVHWILSVQTEREHYGAIVDATTGELHSPEQVALRS